MPAGFPNNMRHSTTKYMVVNPRHTTFRVEKYTVNIRHMTCRICDFMRHFVFFRIESVVLQVSMVLYFSNFYFYEQQHGYIDETI
jgi:hypothetical protein